MTKIKSLLILPLLISGISMLSSCSESTKYSTGISYTLNGDEYIVSDGNMIKDKIITIPPYYKGKKVTCIGENAFNRCEYTEKIVIPEFVKDIGRNAFVDCTSLTEIEVDPSNQYLSSQDGILYTKNIDTLLYFPAKNINTDYIIPDSVTSIINVSFHNASILNTLLISKNVTYISEWVFGPYCSPTFYLEFPSIPSTWDTLWNFYNHQVKLLSAEPKKDCWHYYNNLPVEW